MYGCLTALKEKGKGQLEMAASEKNKGLTLSTSISRLTLVKRWSLPCMLPRLISLMATSSPQRLVAKEKPDHEPLDIY